ncbi:IST1 homolog isoform X2 [Anneissia japonica]|uniref:IST1 homolog isoform X2 n=1 Tax=Anneissia japonica TaxID=1529436 RepID=UPI001425900F|nr:IST1 homolog isoform X2 [Anneissia japonica]
MLSPEVDLFYSYWLQYLHSRNRRRWLIQFTDFVIEMGFNKNKLKVNLKLTINRLKLLEKKKTELALKARKEIADYISNGKDDRARIRVEHIIREDYLVEAMEIIELYCDLLLARFGLIETTKNVEPGLEEAICSILWVAPRLSSDIQELKVISDQLFMKYGKPYCAAARADEHDKVNQRLKLKMSYQAPPQLLVENYLVEIAKSHNVPFEPDPTVLLNPADVESLLIDTDEMGGPPGNSSSGSGGGGGGGGLAQPMPPQPYPYPPTQPQPPVVGMSVGQPQIPAPYPAGPAPPYTSFDPAYPPPMPSAPEKSHMPAASFPELPSVPVSSFPVDSVGKGSAGGEDVDFDDLTKRFEELKKKK